MPVFGMEGLGVRARCFSLDSMACFEGVACGGCVVCGWHAVAGIWPKEADGTDINSVDRSHSGKLYATADDFGKVKVFNCPCVEKVGVLGVLLLLFLV